MAPMSPEDARALGALQAEVKAIADRLTVHEQWMRPWLEEVQCDLKKLAEKVDRMESRMDTAAGGWRLVLIMGVPAAVTGLLATGIAALWNKAHGG